MMELKKIIAAPFLFKFFFLSVAFLDGFFFFFVCVHDVHRTYKRFLFSPYNDRIYLNMMYVVLCANPFFIYCSINIMIWWIWCSWRSNTHLYQSRNNDKEFEMNSELRSGNCRECFMAFFLWITCDRVGKLHFFFRRHTSADRLVGWMMIKNKKRQSQFPLNTIPRLWWENKSLSTV